MKQRTIVAMVVFSGVLAGTAWAQGRGAGVMVPSQVQPAPPQIPTGGFVGMMAVEPFEMGDPVENAPYSAEIVNEVTQHLADGNRIERRTTGTVARDSRGRVRREQQLAAIGPVVPEGDARMVTISDPVARVHYSLDPVRKVAIRSRPPRLARAHPEPEPPDVRTEPLGTKEYEGVRAEGTRTIATVPAGAIGNVRPIEIVGERWYSPDLRVVVFSRRADPRFGETIYRLTSITRTEPDASLFEVPADYKLEDVKPLAFEPPIHPLVVKPRP
jgi:hypothetical protein